MDTGWQDARKAVVLTGRLNYKSAAFGKYVLLATARSTRGSRFWRSDKPRRMGDLTMLAWLVHEWVKAHSLTSSR